MAWKFEYQIIYSESIPELDKMVEDFLNDEWIPVGGVSHQLLENGHFSVCQALQKKTMSE